MVVEPPLSWHSEKRMSQRFEISSFVYEHNNHKCMHNVIKEMVFRINFCYILSEKIVYQSDMVKLQHEKCKYFVPKIDYAGKNVVPVKHKKSCKYNLTYNLKSIRNLKMTYFV